MSVEPTQITLSNEQDNMDGGFVEATDVSKKSSNKNYIETYFHDDDIPQPIVCEGNALVFSKLKESNITQEENINKSMGSFNSSDNVKNLFKPNIFSDIYEEKSREMLKSFFGNVRESRKNKKT